MKKILREIKWFYRKVKRLIEWLPVIWKGYDWDYRYATDVFKYQCLRIAKYMEDYDPHMESKEVAKEIRDWVLELEKVMDEEYSTAYLKEVEDKYGEDATGFCFKPHEGGGYTLEWNYKNMENSEEIKKFQNERAKEADTRQKEHEEQLWKNLEEKIRGWWG